jgi:hypothetical protein
MQQNNVQELKLLKAKSIARQATNTRLEEHKAKKNSWKDARRLDGWQATNFHPKFAYVNGTAEKMRNNIRNRKIKTMNETNRRLILQFINHGIEKRKVIRKLLENNCKRIKGDSYWTKAGCNRLMHRSGSTEYTAKPENASRNSAKAQQNIKESPKQSNATRDSAKAQKTRKESPKQSNASNNGAKVQQNIKESTKQDGTPKNVSIGRQNSTSIGKPGSSYKNRLMSR